MKTLQYGCHKDQTKKDITIMYYTVDNFCSELFRTSTAAVRVIIVATEIESEHYGVFGNFVLEEKSFKPTHSIACRVSNRIQLL